MDRPNPVKAALEILRSLVTVPPPRPQGPGEVDHDGLATVLAALESGGLPGAVAERGALELYLKEMAQVDPDALTRDEALAFWVNLYNASAVELAAGAMAMGHQSVLRDPGAFSEKRVEVNGTGLSLNDIEHAKIRRFKDPRIHGALVCGSLSCPTLRPEPFTGSDIDAELESQMRRFLNKGGVRRVDDETIALSRILLWYGADFVRPHRMPAFLPVSKTAVARAVARWMPDDLGPFTSVEFQHYDWALGCDIG